ncbi:MAG: hypothetical protein ACE5G2_05415 [Candidatus Krumholzibacteriia bacterium]
MKRLLMQRGGARVAATASSFLRKLENSRDSYGGGSAQRKLELLRALERRWLARPRDVLRLHEILCFLRAYPDDPQVLGQVERMLASFADRGDLRRHRAKLADSGIAGTSINFQFFWPTARWLAQRWPDRLSLDWQSFDGEERLHEVLPLLVPYPETGGFDELSFSLREWIERLKGPDETDALFLVRRIEALPGDAFTREAFHDGFDVWFHLEPGPDTPSRTHAKYRAAPVVYQARPLQRGRPSLRDEIRRPPLSVRVVSPREGQKLIDLACGAMVTRSRDLDVFAYGNKYDVRLVDCGEGLQFACIGFVPERRLLLHAVYGFLTLKNGVPMGYVLASVLYRAAGIAYNTFETYRGAEAAQVFGRVLGTVRHLFDTESFSIDPYQLGYGNTEGLKSGAWWFYYKLGFRPRDAEVRRVLRRELARMKKNARHRSSVATLEKLAAEHVFLDLDPAKKEGRLPLWNVSLQISRHLARRFGADRESAMRTCAREAARLLGLRSVRGWSAGERQAWKRWSPLITALPGVGRWGPADKRALVEVVRAKGGRHESDFVGLFDAHRRLRQAVLKLAEAGEV